MFRNRQDAGEQLAARLVGYVGSPDPIVLALPRGGVPVAAGIARTLAAPLDVFIVRKLGVPGFPELAMGAIAEGGVTVVHDRLLHELGIPPVLVQDVTAREQIELARRERHYRGDRPAPRLAGRTVILVDDGLATGATMEAAVEAVRGSAPAAVIVAVPVASREALSRLESLADAVVCLLVPQEFAAVGEWYQDFTQTTDEEVSRLLAC